MAHPGAHEHRHLVELYASDDHLADTVRDHVLPGFAAGGGVLVVATEAHRQLVTERLAAAGVDVAAAIASGQLVVLDARGTFERFMADGAPDAHAFDDVVGGLVRALVDRFGAVRIYGEMVAVLWEDGRVTAAISLEDLWNELAATTSFDLLCAYPTSALDPPGAAAAFDTVLAQHTGAIPDERYLGLADDEARLTAVAELQRAIAATEAERAVLERTRLALEAELGDLRTLDHVRNEFLAMVVHDIRTPTAVVAGFLDVLRSTWTELDAEQVHEFIEQGLDGTRRITRLVDDILTVSRLEAGEFSFDLKPVDLRYVALKVASAVRTATGATVGVDFPDVPLARADEDRQLQILDNLLTNAVKYSPRATRVEVSITERPDCLVVSVRDHGVGMSEEQAQRLFQPFSRVGGTAGARRRVQGTGLGLYIARALVEGQGGSISVETSPGRGSTFSYSVPRWEPAVV